MAYLRRRGNQLAIVAGARNAETKRVEQRILFTLYSRPEALEVIGRGQDEHAAARFEMLMKNQHPDVAFNWKSLRKAIAADLKHLPESYAYGDSRLKGRFREDLVNFARSLMLADPQELVAAGALIRESRSALEYISELIAWRLETCAERDVNEWNSDNPFYWRFTLQGKGVPHDAEEQAASLWEKRDLPHAEAAFQILIDAFPEYAEGYNYLGLIALERDDLGRAEEHFKKTIEIGRTLLPKRVARSSWWSDHKTRPYMRGLRNLANALVRTGKYDEATEVVDRLERECADDLSASSFRAAIALNTGEWRVAAESAGRLRGLWPEEGLLEGLARVELGEVSSALEPLVHAALNKPRAVRLVLGLASSAPKTFFEAEDHNVGVHIRQMLTRYLSKKTRGVALLRRFASDERLARSMRRVEDLCGKWFGHPKADRSIFDELTGMQKAGYAATQARLLADSIGRVVIPPGGKSTPAAKGRSRDRTSARSLH